MLDVKFLGPPLDAGPLPAVFYFALSAHDSLHLDPYNQPVHFLQSPDLRIFSITLPGHDRYSPQEALQHWTGDILHSFLKEAAAYIQSLPMTTKIGVMGLSRGVFIAAHIAALLPEISFLLGFAPLTHFESLPDLALPHLSDKLYNRSVRCYIGNRDIRVGTDRCFQWISHLAETAYRHRISSSPFELIIGPSIGHQGHGTSPQVFKQGALWLRQKLLGEDHG